MRDDTQSVRYEIEVPQNHTQIMVCVCCCVCCRARKRLKGLQANNAPIDPVSYLDRYSKGEIGYEVSMTLPTDDLKGSIGDDPLCSYTWRSITARGRGLEQASAVLCQPHPQPI